MSCLLVLPTKLRTSLDLRGYQQKKDTFPDTGYLCLLVYKHNKVSKIYPREPNITAAHEKLFHISPFCLDISYESSVGDTRFRYTRI